MEEPGVVQLRAPLGAPLAIRRHKWPKNKHKSHSLFQLALTQLTAGADSLTGDAQVVVLSQLPGSCRVC